MAIMTTPPAAGHHQHLYLVLESSEDEYSIHKIDVRDFDPDDADDLDSRTLPLPDPPLLRVEAESYSATSFVAHGAKIFAMAPSPGGAGLAIDTRTMRITAAPLPQANTEPYNCSGLIVVGDRIYSMDAKKGDGEAGSCNFEVLSFGSTASRCPSSISSHGGCWSWSSVPSQPPFDPVCTTCYAVHPDGRTIFFSAPHGEEGAGATFYFDTERVKWTFRGHWMLPFHGQAHYDEELCWNC